MCQSCVCEHTWTLQKLWLGFYTPDSLYLVYNILLAQPALTFKTFVSVGEALFLEAHNSNGSELTGNVNSKDISA
jgi:hypothetical protein